MGIDSGVSHAVSGDAYGDVRTAAFMGYTIIARQCGASITSLKRFAAEASRDNAGKLVDRSALPFRGYLARITPSEFDGRYRDDMPHAMTGKEFLSTFGPTIDPATSVRKQSNYAVLACSRHPVAENFRAQLFLQLIARLQEAGRRQTIRQQLLEELGELMFQSHQSYSDCGLDCEATDALVNAVREAGPARGVYGARVTGGGSGGTVCVICDGKLGIATANHIARECSQQHDQQLTVFNGSSAGAFFTPVSQTTT